VNRALGVVKFSEDLRVCDDGFLEIRFGWWYVLFVIAVCVPAEILSWTVLWSEHVNRIVSHSTSNIQASSQHREQGVHPCAVVCPVVPDPAY
jgi:hypothetical protein